MHITLWLLQILLAIHTFIGAIWKFSNSEQMVASLEVIPHWAWLTLGVLDLFIGLSLILPGFIKSISIIAPIAAMCIVAEMLMFTLIHLASGHSGNGQVVYWMLVAAICAFIAYGRFVLKPSHPKA